jgi:3-methyladenine DNA glycosylase AlkD
MTTRTVMAELRRLGDPAVVAGMARFGIPSDNALGISAPKLRALGKIIGRDQVLSLELWKTGVLEARAIAALIGDPGKVTRRQMNRWVVDFDSWGVCDACCALLFVFTPYALEMAFKWVKSEREFVRRAGFVLMAESAIHLKGLSDREFLPMLKEIRLGATDERNFVRKAVNWALRQVGKRNRRLNALSIKEANRIRKIDSRAARWIAADALRELQSAQVQKRLQKWEEKSRMR